MESEPLRVAVGVILRHTSQGAEVCISLRPKHLHKGGLWEFPGGKIEPGESLFSALQREIKEELDIDVMEAEPMQQILWHYPEKQVLLEVMKVTAFVGTAKGVEGQQVEWIKLDHLDDYDFPEANVAIIESLKATISSK